MPERVSARQFAQTLSSSLFSAENRSQLALQVSIEILHLSRSQWELLIHRFDESIHPLVKVMQFGEGIRTQGAKRGMSLIDQRACTC